MRRLNFRQYIEAVPGRVPLIGSDDPTLINGPATPTARPATPTPGPPGPRPRSGPPSPVRTGPQPSGITPRGRAMLGGTVSNTGDKTTAGGVPGAAQPNQNLVPMIVGKLVPRGANGRVLMQHLSTSFTGLQLIDLVSKEVFDAGRAAGIFRRNEEGNWDIDHQQVMRHPVIVQNYGLGK